MTANNNALESRIVFMGTSELSEVILWALIRKKYNIVGVFTKPDAQVGRKQIVTQSLVKIMANKHEIPVFQPSRFNAEAVELLEKLKPDLVVVAAYGKILPKKALETPQKGCLNVHVSLLPKYRGPSPIQNVLLAGEKETGITIMMMDEGVDTGDILSQRKIKISPEDTSATLSHKISLLGADLLESTIELLLKDEIERKPQDHTQATYCQLIERSDGKIFWTDSAEEIYNKYRGLTPWPGIFTYWKNDSENVRLKLITIGLQNTSPLVKYKTGEVFEIGDDIGVQADEGVVILKEIQMEGKKVVDMKSFLNGYPNFMGSILY